MADNLERYYHILGLEPDASPEAVKVAYRDCVDAWHPDRFTHSPERQQRAQARLKLINEAYKQLRRHAAASRSNSSTASAQANPTGPSPGSTSSAKTASQGAPGEHGPKTSYYRANTQQSRTKEPEPPPEPSRSPHSWLELSRESRFTVTMLYYSFIGVVTAAGCGLSLGGMYFGPLGAICGILVSPLMGLTMAAISAVVSAVIAGKLGGIRGNLIGGSLALLVPGTVCGAVLVWSISRSILGDMRPPMLDITLGGAMGAGCGMGLGAWTGKAISIAMGELKEVP